MKKYLLLSIVALSTIISNAQSVVTTIDTIIAAQYSGTVPTAALSSHNFTGEVIEIVPAPALNNSTTVILEIENQSGDTVEWTISRRRINVDTNWADFIVWAHESDQFGGLGVSTEFMDSTLWTGPCQFLFELELADGEHAILGAYISLDENTSGCGTYRYYVGPCSNPYQDSVDINICYTVGIEEQSAISSFEVFPNPASDIINIKAEIDHASIEIIDVLGKVISTKSFSNTMPLNVSTLENGIYFILLQKEGIEPVKKKIIIQH